MQKILFQGDSITDFNRERKDTKGDWLGHGYATMVAGDLGAEYPGKFEFLNKGISGNRIIDVLARVKSDIINLSPDFISILIGINDVWHEIESQDGVDGDYFETYYNILINQIKNALPDTKIMIMEPFVLKTGATEEKWDIFRTETEKRASVARDISEKNNTLFVPLMKEFDEAAKSIAADYWLYDGVHPTAAGHGIIKHEWIKAFKEISEI